MSYSTGYGARSGALSGVPQARHASLHSGYGARSAAHPLPDEDWAEEARFMAGGDTAAYAAGGAGHGGRERGGAFRALCHATGALASIALMVWIGVWGYGQVMRDVRGVPVVQALEGPMRELPEQPGGTISQDFGLAVNAVQAGATERDLSEAVRLAPSDVTLAEEDVPVDDLARRVLDMPAPIREAAAPPAAPVQPAGEAPGVVSASLPAEAAAEEAADPFAAMRPQVPPSPDAEEAEQPRALSDAEALANALTAGLQPLLAEADAPAEPAAVVPASVRGVSRSPRPATRPAAWPATVASFEATPAALTRDIGPAVQNAVNAAVATGTASATAVAPGTRLVQLGAFDSVDAAHAAWADLVRRFEPQMADKARVVQQAEAGGRAFWRLRAQGFADLSEARRFCSDLIAQSADCIPVVAR